MIKIKRQSGGKKTCLQHESFLFFVFLVNGSQMMFWFGLKQAHTDTCIHTHTNSLFFSPPHSLFIIMLTLLVLRGRRQRDSLLFHEGRLISAKSVYAPHLIPHHSHIVWLPGISEISHLPNPLEMWEICPPLWGIPHPSCRKLCGES